MKIQSTKYKTKQQMQRSKIENVKKTLQQCNDKDKNF